MKKDLENRKDIELLVDRFYEKVLKDETIGRFFTLVAKIDWSKHIPVMYDFWETTLLGEIKYRGNPMVKHMELNKKATLSEEHFEVWLSLWQETIDEHFAGTKATEAKVRAESISQIMLYKIHAN